MHTNTITATPSSVAHHLDPLHRALNRWHEGLARHAGYEVAFALTHDLRGPAFSEVRSELITLEATRTSPHASAKNLVAAVDWHVQVAGLGMEKVESFVTLFAHMDSTGDGAGFSGIDLKHFPVFRFLIQKNLLAKVELQDTLLQFGVNVFDWSIRLKGLVHEKWRIPLAAGGWPVYTPLANREFFHRH